MKNPSNGQHPERDQNEIGTRYQFSYFEATKEQDREALQDTLGLSLLACLCPETPQKGDTRLKNEIGMNLGNSFLPPLIWS